MNRKPEKAETTRKRQQRLRERRKELGFKRITIWLSPGQVDTLERFGGEPWLGTTVKVFLESAVTEHATRPEQQAGLFGNPELQPGPVSDTDKTGLWAEAERLQAAGLSWNEVARRWNEQGRRTDKGADYRGANIAREVRKLKGGTGE